MNNLTRRKFLQNYGTLAATGTAGIALWPTSVKALSKKPVHHIVIVGGGFGGATCAKYIKRYDPSISVTLIERSRIYTTCPFSNLVVGGLQDLQSIRRNYFSLQNRHKINVIHEVATNINAEAKTITTNAGRKLNYDKLVMSPGVDFNWSAIEGHSKALAETLPHAWQAGQQTVTLRNQLVAMPDGGVVVIVAPPNPFRCPPGPYERASLIANYLKTNKPKSKILILDAKSKFSKQSLFMQGWEKHYPGMIEWVSGSSGGEIVRLDPTSKTLYNALDEKFKGDVINLIPAQKAASIAQRFGLTNKNGWCPINQKTFESTIHKDIHVIGDSSIAGAMPKSGFSANNQAKVCAAAIVADLNGAEMPDPSYANTCYSLVNANYGISVAAIYRNVDGTITKVAGSGGISPADGSNSYRQAEAGYAKGWYAGITADTFL